MPITARSATPAFGPSTSQEPSDSDSDFVFLFSSIYPTLSQAKLRLATMFSKLTPPLIPKSTENDSPAEKQKQKLYQQLLKRFQELETSHTKLQQQLNKLAREREGRRMESTQCLVSGSQIEASGGCFQGIVCKNPYWNILQSMGHAVHVCKPPGGKIIFWNRSAENLYGWKDYEILGRRVVEMLINEKEYMLVDKIMQRLNNGESWSGQFPFRKRSGEMFMAIVTESPMYEDAELTGIITVSSDASLFNNIKLENLKEYQKRAHQRPREEGQSGRKIQWQPPTQIASSLSNLASKVFSRQHGDTSDGDARTNNSGEWMREVEQTQSEESKASVPMFGVHVGKRTTEERKNKGPLFEFVQPSKIAEKVLSKLNIDVGSNSSSRTNGSTQLDSADISARNSSKKPTESSSKPILKEHYYTSFNGIDSLGLEENIDELSNPNKDTLNPFDQVSYAIRKKLNSPQLGYDECFGKERLKVMSPRQDSDQEENGSTSAEIIPPKMPEVIQSPKSSGECNSASSHTSSSSRVEIESSSLADCEILWEDLHLGDEIGKGNHH